jgi:MTH538 TIR-like domain (DUF1863)
LSGPVYTIFDGDLDKWAWAYFKGWKANKNIDLDFVDAHDLDSMTGRAQDEGYVKSILRERMKKSSAVIVLIGEKTKNLYKYVKWELELALDLGLPIIAVNLNNKTQLDRDLCPAILRDRCAMHIPLKLEAIKHALTTWPHHFNQFEPRTKSSAGAYYYANPDWYKSMGL